MYGFKIEKLCSAFQSQQPEKKLKLSTGLNIRVSEVDDIMFSLDIKHTVQIQALKMCIKMLIRCHQSHSAKVKQKCIQVRTTVFIGPIKGLLKVLSESDYKYKTITSIQTSVVYSTSVLGIESLLLSVFASESPLLFHTSQTSQSKFFMWLFSLL